MYKIQSIGLMVTFAAFSMLAGCDLYFGSDGGARPKGPGAPVAMAPDAAVSSGTPVDLLAQWSGCMTLADFQSANMAQAWGSLQTDAGPRCASCHTTGGDGFLATELEEFFFDELKTNRRYLSLYFRVDSMHVPPEVVVNTLTFQAVAMGQPPHVAHPKFDASNNSGMTALVSFYDLTKLHLALNDCGPPSLVN
jgi:hypothetical protein